MRHVTQGDFTEDELDGFTETKTGDKPIVLQYVAVC